MSAPQTEEVMAAYAFVAATLSADATLAGLQADRVYREIAPAGAAYPYTVMAWQGGFDVRGVGGGRLMSRVRLLVKAVAEGQDGTIVAPIAARTAELLDDGAGDAGAWHVESVRLSPMSLPVTDNGVVYQQLGGQYEFYVYPR